MSIDFDNFVNEALAQGFSGWDFSYLNGRWQEDAPSWDYRQCVIDHIGRATALLDMGTGGGEFLACLPERPAFTCATENFPANIAVAKSRLEPLGIEVLTLTDDQDLPFRDNTFDLIINRHETFSASELYRVLKRGGFFLTQQVGGSDNIELNHKLFVSNNTAFESWSLHRGVHLLKSAGFEITRQLEEYPLTVFKDIGAIIYYLKAIPWQIPDFDVHTYQERLFTLHEQISQSGRLSIKSHRFYIECFKK